MPFGDAPWRHSRKSRRTERKARRSGNVAKRKQRRQLKRKYTKYFHPARITGYFSSNHFVKRVEDDSFDLFNNELKIYSLLRDFPYIPPLKKNAIKRARRTGVLKIPLVGKDLSCFYTDIDHPLSPIPHKAASSRQRKSTRKKKGEEDTVDGSIVSLDEGKHPFADAFTPSSLFSMFLPIFEILHCQYSICHCDVHPRNLLLLPDTLETPPPSRTLGHRTEEMPHEREHQHPFSPFIIDLATSRVLPPAAPWLLDVPHGVPAYMGALRHLGLAHPLLDLESLLYSALRVALGADVLPWMAERDRYPHDPASASAAMVRVKLQVAEEALLHGRYPHRWPAQACRIYRSVMNAMWRGHSDQPEFYRQLKLIAASARPARPGASLSLSSSLRRRMAGMLPSEDEPISRCPSTMFDTPPVVQYATKRPTHPTGPPYVANATLSRELGVPVRYLHSPGSGDDRVTPYCLLSEDKVPRYGGAPSSLWHRLGSPVTHAGSDDEGGEEEGVASPSRELIGEFDVGVRSLYYSFHDSMLDHFVTVSEEELATRLTTSEELIRQCKHLSTGVNQHALTLVHSVTWNGYEDSLYLDLGCLKKQPRNMTPSAGILRLQEHVEQSAPLALLFSPLKFRILISIHSPTALSQQMLRDMPWAILTAPAASWPLKLLSMRGRVDLCVFPTHPWCSYHILSEHTTIPPLRALLWTHSHRFTPTVSSQHVVDALIKALNGDDAQLSSLLTSAVDKITVLSAFEGIWNRCRGQILLAARRHSWLHKCQHEHTGTLAPAVAYADAHDMPQASPHDLRQVRQAMADAPPPVSGSVGWNGCEVVLM
eukprot:gnl/Dysnectes_brevis/3953_a5151_664.p1 GENE.gnl/Dysnectes_brevis/3953_a5151_664~~gnl/Dysnectes_brevis/3953_a5151_664.p1  ORF type:complete len:824 (+),score=173.42 gnl/Dysnectes_brevis/3953_a5151_664:63-2534(+)